MTENQTTIKKLHFDCSAYRKFDMPTTEIEVTRFITNLTKNLEGKISLKLREVCNRQKLGSKVYELFVIHYQWSSVHELDKRN